MTGAGVVLAGGRSSRMGRPKAELPWRGRTLLERTVEVVGRGCGGPVVVVRAPGQRLPPLPAAVLVVDDPVEGLGPLQGIAVGLAAAGAAEATFVCSTDLPFLHEAYVARVLAALDDPSAPYDLVLPMVGGFRQPLAAAYRTALAGLCAELVADGRRRPGALAERVRTVVLDEAALLADPVLAAADPDLLSVRGVNTPEQYAEALASGGPIRP